MTLRSVIFAMRRATIARKRGTSHWLAEVNCVRNTRFLLRRASRRLNMCRQTTAQKKILKMSSQYSPSGASRARLAHSVPNCSLTEKRSRWKIDTGAAVSLISEQQQKSLLPEATIQPSTLKLKTYTGEQMSVLGELPVEVNYEDQTANLVLVVVAGDGPRLFGRSWLQHLRLDWKTIANVAPTHTSLEQLLEQHSPIFKDELGTITAKLALQDNVVPKFRRPRPVPFSIKQEIEKELEKLEKAGKVSYSEWAAPIVRPEEGRKNSYLQ